MSQVLLDAAGRRRSPGTMPAFHARRPPRNKGMRYPADPPTVEEIVAVMRAAGARVHGQRLRGSIVLLWRAGRRISEALSLGEADLDPRRGSVLVRRGKGGRRREVGMDEWGWEQLQPWLAVRRQLPVGPLFGVVTGATRGRAWSTPRARRASPGSRSGRRTAPLRAAPAPACPRCRARTRRCAADRHPAPTRAHEARDHVGLPARHRQRRDHRHRTRPSRAHDPGENGALAGRAPEDGAARRQRDTQVGSCLGARCSNGHSYRWGRAPQPAPDRLPG